MPSVVFYWKNAVMLETLPPLQQTGADQGALKFLNQGQNHHIFDGSKCHNICGSKRKD